MSYEPPSKLATDLLMSGRFTPFGAGFLLPQTVADQENVPLAEAQKCLAEFAAAGLVAEEKVLRATEPHYKPTAQGWQERERLLREHGLRHPALTNQRKFDLPDLIVALIMARHLFNRRLPGGFFASTTAQRVDQLAIYLGDYSEDEIAKVCGDLVRSRVLQAQGGATFDIAILGHRAYEEEVQARLHLAAGETILDEVLNKVISVFFAWQSEFTRSRNTIGDVLERVLGELNKVPALVRPLKLVLATEAGDGAVRIDQQLLDRVKDSEFFIGDTTPVARDGDRLRVNDNVLVETGYALASKPPGRVILLAMRRDDLAGDGARVAFDIANVRRHDFETRDGLRKWLSTELEAALREQGWLH